MKPMQHRTLSYSGGKYWGLGAGHDARCHGDWEGLYTKYAHTQLCSIQERAGKKLTWQWKVWIKDGVVDQQLGPCRDSVSIGVSQDHALQRASVHCKFIHTLDRFALRNTDARMSPWTPRVREQWESRYRLAKRGDFVFPIRPRTFSGSHRVNHNKQYSNKGMGDKGDIFPTTWRSRKNKF